MGDALPRGLERDAKDALRQVRGGLRKLKAVANRAAAYDPKRAELLDRAHEAAVLARELAEVALFGRVITPTSKSSPRSAA